MLSIVQSKKNATAGFWNYANSFTYTAAGAVSSMQLGNGKWESTQFNSRLQPTQIALGTIQNGTDKLKLNYEYGNLDIGTGQTIAGTNNGNVSKQIITTPGNTQTSTAGFSATQYYSYDSLNRLQIATENIQTDGQPSAVLGWRQQYIYDRFGNRNFDEANTTTLTKLCGTSPNYTVCPNDRKVENPEIEATNNRIKELQPDGDSNKDYEFDTSGNTEKDPDGRTFIYDGENKQIEVKDSSDYTIGRYFYDGDGKRVKKIEYSSNTPIQTTIFIYDASGKMVAEYSTIVAPTQTAQVSYLTNDHLGSPRITTDKDGKVFSRRDFMPFGEEITLDHTTQRDVNLNYGEDGIRQKFTSYERDNESRLDFAQARYHNYNLGRFNSPDPLYFQFTMVVDPQFFNLYTYVRNNPLRLVDPSGESVLIRGANTINSFYEQVGGKEEFEKYFYFHNGGIFLKDDADLSGANEGVQNLAGLVGADEQYLFYYGNDFGEIADLFEGATKVNDDGEITLTRFGRGLSERFVGNQYGNNRQIGYIVAVAGRPSSYAQPASGSASFAVIALNSDIPMIQTDIETRRSQDSSQGTGIVAYSGQLSGLGQRISAASFFIHEGAEAQTFKRIGFKDYKGNTNYYRSHQEAMRIEERIRESVKLTGGFSGGIPSREQ